MTVLPSPEALAARAAELGYTHLALTDHDDLGGAVRFSRACTAAGISPLLGAEITLADGSHLTLVVENLTGWRNLCSLLSAARMDSPRGAPRVSFDALAARAEGLVALSGCPEGRLAACCARSGTGPPGMGGELRDAFGERFHLEMWDHRTHQEASLCADLLDLAREMELPWTVTHDVHYADAAGRAVHDLLTCIRRDATLDEAHRRGWLRPSAEWCLQPPAEMARRWRSAPEGIRRTREIAERCAGFKLLEMPTSSPASHLPAGVGVGGRDAGAPGARRPARAAAGRVGEALERSLSTSCASSGRMGMADHFLVVWDICRFARETASCARGAGPRPTRWSATRCG